MASERKKFTYIYFCISFALLSMVTIIVDIYRHFMAGTIQHVSHLCFMQSQEFLCFIF